MGLKKQKGNVGEFSSKAKAKHMGCTGYFWVKMRFSGSSLLRSSVSRSRVSALVSQTMVLYLLGLLAYGFWQAKLWVEYLHENIEIQVFLNELVSPGEVNRMIREVRRMPEVKQASYVSKAAAAEEMSRDLGEDFVSFLGENPLMASVKVRVRYSYVQELPIQNLVSRLRAYKVVSEVVYPRHLLTSLQENFRSMAVVLLALSGILLLVTWLLIDQSVRLAIFADRHLIRSMQLVGAEDAFIRWPYLRSAMTGSAVSWLVALTGVVLTALWAMQWAPDFHWFSSHSALLWMGLGLGLFALMVGWLSHYAALNKYLRLDSDQLH
jgi:cell division transport system permease protein